MSPISQMVKWTLRRYVRYVVLGAVVTCVTVNIALHAGAGLTYLCEEECTLQSLFQRISPFNSLLLNYVRANMLDPPSPKGSYRPTHDPTNPPWSVLGRWGDAHKVVVDFFKEYKTPARYVEVGAQDGEFMSMTAHLDGRFQGLLIEPNPRDYALLLSRRRNAYSIQACASPYGVPAKLQLWLRHNSGNLPPLLDRVQQGSNRLYAYVAKEDQDLGERVVVQCLPLATMIQAAFHSTQVDLLTISTHGGELDILATLRDDVLCRMLVVMAPMASQEDMDYLRKLTREMNKTMIYSKSNVHVFLPSNEVAVTIV